MEKKMQTEYAPLVIFVYNRAELAKKMLEAINNNQLAYQTEVFIFSDGPKEKEDIRKVELVRECIHSFKKKNNFKAVTIYEAEKNRGLANSIIAGVSKIIKTYGRVIVLEDDLLTASNFLNFMNECLEYYEKNERIWSIGGTTYRLNALKKYPHDVYACYRGESCGWATWIDRWELVDWNVSDFEELMRSWKKRRHFKRGGQDMVNALKMQMDGKTDSWAIRWCYQESKNNMITILPVKSLVKNIGWGETGTHTHDDVGLFHTEIEGENYNYTLENVDINKSIMRDFRKYFYKPFIQRILDWLYLKLKG